MTAPSISPAVSFARERSPGAEPALVTALPELSPAVQSATFAVLVEQADSSVLQDLVARFQEFGEGFQAILLRHVGGLSAALREAIRSSAVEARRSAIELIARSQSGKDAYLLAEALSSSCPITRERAAVALREMTAWLVDPTGTHSSETLPARSAQTETRPSGRETGHAQATFLADALAAAVLGWEHHFRLEVLEAALWLGANVEWAIRKKLQEPRTRIARPLSDKLSRAADPRLAGFVLRALAIPELRPSAVRAIERAKDPSFIRALASEIWLLADPEIQRGSRWIRELRWLGQAEPVERLEARRTVHARGLTTESAEGVYRLAHDPADMVRNSAVSMLGALPTAASRRILRAAVDDPDAGVQASAIEVLDILGVEDRAAQIEPKLVSPDSRVRACAVKSLLPLEVRKAGDVLLDMLEDSSCAHRLGALWVIERLELRAAVHRVRELCLVDSAERVRQSARRVVSVLVGDSELQPEGTVPHGWNAKTEGDDR